jgi:hypothetical protein
MSSGLVPTHHLPDVSMLMMRSAPISYQTFWFCFQVGVLGEDCWFVNQGVVWSAISKWPGMRLSWMVNQFETFLIVIS